MKEPKNIQNIKSFFSAIDKMNPYIKNHSNIRKVSKTKKNIVKKINKAEELTNPNLSKNEINPNYNIIYQTNNNNKTNQISSHKNGHNNANLKRSNSKNIFNNININNFNSMNKKDNKSSEKIYNNSKEKNKQILFINKGKGIVLNKVNIFQNVKFRKPSLNKNINKINKIDNKINSNNTNANSNTNTIVQSLSSLNMTSTDITNSTKRIKENNIFNIENKLNKEIEISKNNINLNNHNQKNECNTFGIVKNKRHNINKNLLNITNGNEYNPAYTNNNTNNYINSLYQFYKDILPKTNNLLNKNKKPKNLNLNIKNLKKSNNKQNLKNTKKKRSMSQYNFYNISKKIVKTKKNLSLHTISNNISKKEEGGTIISDDSVFNISKRRSSSGTHNDSSKISKGSGTMSFDKKSKSISIDYTYSDDEVQTNRRKKGNQLHIDNNKETDNKKFTKENEINIHNNEFKNFCEDLSSKLFGK